MQRLTRPESSVSLAMRGYDTPAVHFIVTVGIDEMTNLVRTMQNVVHIPTEWAATVTTP